MWPSRAFSLHHTIFKLTKAQLPARNDTRQVNLAARGLALVGFTNYSKFKYGGSGRTRTCFHKLYFPKAYIANQPRASHREHLLRRVGRVIVVWKGGMPALCFNHVKLPIHIKTHLNSSSTLVAISLTIGRNSMCFYMNPIHILA